MKTKRILATLVSAACVAGSAFGLSACGDSEGAVENKDPVYAVYQSYVAYAEDNNQNVLSYEDWLKTVKGEQGAPGAPGQPGKDGTDGATWLVGTADPAASAGKVGDLYLNTTTYDIFLKGDNGWTKTGNIKGADGADGQDGQDGQDGAPGTPGSSSGGQGSDGADGADGEDGEDGATWHIGTADPAASAGKVGDLYLNTTTYDIFHKGSDGWTKIGNIKGADGQDGQDGQDGAPGQNGADGQDGVSVKDVQSEIVNVNGEDYIRFTFILSNGNKIETDVKYQSAASSDKLVRVYSHGMDMVKIGTDPKDLYSMLSVEAEYETSHGLVGEMVSIAETNCDLNLIDTGNVGIYTLRGEYKGFEFELKVLVFDPTTEGYLLEAAADFAPEIYVGADVEELYYMVSNTQVTFIYSDGDIQSSAIWEMYSQDEINAMLEEIDSDNPGDYTLNLKYQGMVFDLTIKIVESSWDDSNWDEPDPELMAKLTGEDNKSVFAYAGSPVLAMELYSDQTAVLYMGSDVVAFDGEGELQYTTVNVRYDFIFDDPASEMPTAIVIIDGATRGAIYNIGSFDVDLENNLQTAVFSDYSFDNVGVSGTMSGTNAEGKDFTLTLYENGMAVMEVDGQEWNVGVSMAYDEEDNYTSYVNIPGVAYYTAEIDEGIILSPIVSEPEESQEGTFYGTFTAISATSYYKSGRVVPELGWSQVLLTVRQSDGLAYGMEFYEGKIFRVVFTCTLEDGGETMRLTTTTSDGQPFTAYLTFEGDNLVYTYYASPNESLERGVGIFKRV